MTVPRPLTARERSTLLRLADPALFDGAAEYRAQVEHAQVVGMCECGCATIDIAVDRSAAPRSPVPGRPLLPVEGEQDSLTLVCFAPDGWLETLEVISVSDEPPAELPDPETWRLTRISSPDAGAPDGDVGDGQVDARA